MWVASKIGFFSVTISKEDGPAQFRARVYGDLDELRAFLSEKGIALSETLTIPTADYRYRAFLDRDQLSAVFGALAETINYSNFKGEIGASPTQRHKLGAYHDVWEVLYRLQE